MAYYSIPHPRGDGPMNQTYAYTFRHKRRGFLARMFGCYPKPCEHQWYKTTFIRETCLGCQSERIHLGVIPIVDEKHNETGEYRFSKPMLERQMLMYTARRHILGNENLKDSSDIENLIL